MRTSFRAVRQRPSQRRRPFASISLIQSRATLQHCEVRARGLPVFCVALHLPAYQCPDLPRAALTTGKFEAIKNPARWPGPFRISGSVTEMLPDYLINIFVEGREVWGGTLG